MKILEQEGKDKRVKILEEEINEKSKYLKTEYKWVNVNKLVNV